MKITLMANLTGQNKLTPDEMDSIRQLIINYTADNNDDTFTDAPSGADYAICHKPNQGPRIIVMVQNFDEEGEVNDLRYYDCFEADDVNVLLDMNCPLQNYFRELYGSIGDVNMAEHIAARTDIEYLLGGMKKIELIEWIVSIMDGGNNG